MGRKLLLKDLVMSNHSQEDGDLVSTTTGAMHAELGSTIDIPKSNTYFTADIHFGHRLMVEGGESTGNKPLRPYANLDEMNHALIKNWNAKIPTNGIVYFLGDFSFASNTETLDIIRQLNGNLHLIIGNHDEGRMTKKTFSEFFVWQKHYAKIKVRDLEAPNGKSRNIVLCHYPFMTWDGSERGVWHLHGHSHGNLISGDQGYRLDVGVDCHNYTPLSYEEVKEIMSTRTFVAVDHHKPK